MIETDMRYLVLDQNFMRTPELRGLVEGRSDTSFIVPDTALVEMAKHERWEDTMRGSFEALASAVDRTYLSISVSEAMKTELRDRRAITRAELLPDNFTKTVRELIRALAGSVESDAIDGIRQHINAIRPEVMAEQLDADREKETALFHEKKLKETFPKLVEDLVKNRIDRTARLGIIQLIGHLSFAAEFGSGRDQLRWRT